MHSAQLKQILHEGRTAFGTMVVSTSPAFVPHIAGAGLDCVFLDTEHIPIERQTLAWMCRAYAGAGLAPIVRIPSPDPYAACQVLDGGAQGVVAPYVESIEEVKALVGAVKLRPLKGEKLRRVLNGEEVLEGELKEYIKSRSKDSILLVNIESTPAIRALSELLSVPGLDGVLLGPHDLSCSLGIPEQYEHPDFKTAITTIAQSARKRGLIAGAHYMCPQTKELAAEWMASGYNLIIQRADVVYAARGVAEEVTALRAMAGEENAVSDESINI